MSGVTPRAAEYDINQCIWKLAKLFREHTLHTARTLDATWNGKLTPCSRQADSQLSTFFFLLHRFPFVTSLIPIPDLKRRPFSRQWFLPIFHLLVSCVFLTARQILPWGYSLASLATPSYKVKKDAHGPFSAIVCVKIGATALTNVVKSAARCVWTCAPACGQETAATLSVHSASVGYKMFFNILPRQNVTSEAQCKSNTAVVQNTYYLLELFLKLF